MNAHTAIKLDINQDRLFANLSTIFSNAGVVIRELVQNARRSGSDRIDVTTLLDETTDQLTVTIRDYGKGISSLQNLFTLAESGWEESLIQDENAFGMGFYSVLYCTEKVRVTSLGSQLEFDCVHLINGGEVIPTAIDSDEISEGTSIELIGFNGFKHNGESLIGSLQLRSLTEALKNIAEGEESYISLNGELLAAPLARRSLSARKKIKSDAGELYLETDEYGFVVIPSGPEHISLAFFLQGIEVYSTLGSRRVAPLAVVHLDNSILARMPDRDKLIHQKDVIDCVGGTIKKFFSEFLSEQLNGRIETESEELETFLCSNWLAMKYFCPDILTTIDMIPASLFQTLDYPIADDYEVNILSDAFPGQQTVSRDVLKKFKIFESYDSLFEEEEYRDETESDYTRAMWVHASDQLVLSKHEIPCSHWIFEIVESHIPSDFQIEMIEPNEPAIYHGEWIWQSKVTLCQQVSISYKGESVQIVDAFSTGNGFVVPSQETTGWVVQQVCTFTDENDSDNNEARTREESQFSGWLSQHRADSDADLLQILLRGISEHSLKLLASKSFVVNFDDSEVPVITVAEYK